MADPNASAELNALEDAASDIDALDQITAGAWAELLLALEASGWRIAEDYPGG